MEEPKSLFHRAEAISPHRPPVVLSGLPASPICRMLAAGRWLWFLWIHQPKVRPRRTHCLTKTGWSSGCCRTCFWVKSKLSHPHICLFIWRKLVCILWGKENMMIVFGLESDIVSVIICSLLTDSIPLKYNLACRECWTTGCGYVGKYTVSLRGRCI